MQIKRFTAWLGLKEKLHNQTYKPPLFREGEIWWKMSVVKSMARAISLVAPCLFLENYLKILFLVFQQLLKIEKAHGTFP